MKKFLFLLIIMIITTMSFSQSTADLNPHYPRIAMLLMDPPVHSYSNGNLTYRLKDFCLVIINGTSDEKGDVLGSILRAQNPKQILLAAGVNGVNTNDPGRFFLCSSSRVRLTKPVVPKQSTISVDSRMVFQSSYTYMRIKDDVILATSVPNDSTIIVATSGNDAINVAHAAGDTCIGVYRALGQGFRPFFSEYCPTIDGDRVCDDIADQNYVQEINWSTRLFDGFFHDYFNVNMPVGSNTNFDFDFNGIDDRTEHTEDWMTARWKYGMDQLVNAETAKMNSIAPGMPNLYVVNTGSSLTDYYDKANGHMFEGYQRFTTWFYIHLNTVKWLAQGIKPSFIFFFDYFPEKHFFDGKNRFTQMRFGLTHSMIDESVYAYTGGDTYNYWYWYDEYETDMGYPTSDIQTLNGQTYLLLRYFDNGCVICNGTGENQVISASQLSGGPYYFLKGGQDPSFNNGQQFTGTLTLSGINYGNHNLRGDGVLLFKHPTTSVTDIVVDNFFMNFTSPGSDAVRLVGTWRKKSSTGYADFTQNNPYWALNGSKAKIAISNYDVDGANGVFDENYGYHASSAGNGENTATYIPNIGVPGWYEVSEWHGWDGDTPGAVVEATNVPFEINVSGQAKIRGTINQSINYGQWNRLGYVNLPVGKVGFVRITNKTNGVVIADAMRFHYMGDNYIPDTTPPASPKNVKVY